MSGSVTAAQIYPDASPPRLPHQTDDYLSETKGPSINGVCITVSVLSTLFVLARLFVRQKFLGKLHLEDYIVAVSLLFQWACVSLAIEAVRNGNGRHFDTLSLNDKQSTIFWTVLNFPFGIIAFGLPKLAVVILLTRLLNPRPRHRLFLWVLVLVCLVALLGCIVVLYAQCTPARSQWDFSITNKRCISKRILVSYAIFAGSLSAFTDLYLAVYPAIILWGLQLKLGKKVGLCVALGIGSIASVVAIYKCTRLPSLASSDFSYDTADLVIWTIVEAATIIIACCIPVLQPLMDVLLGRRTLHGSMRYRNYSSSGHTPPFAFGSEVHKSAPAGSRPRRSTHQSQYNAKKNDPPPANRDAGESDDSILAHTDEVGILNEAHLMKPVRPQYAHHAHNISEEELQNRILRTDIVTITYDAGGGGMPSNRETSWMRI